MDDGELVARAQQGDRAALEDLLQKHYSTWYQISRRMMGNDADAADATQEGLVAVVKGLNRFDGRAKFSTWSYRVVVNRCHDELRRRKRQPVPNAFEPDTTPSTGNETTTTGSVSIDPARQVITSIDLDQKLSLLSEEYRTILILREVLGYDYAEIADALSLPMGTVRSRLARARSKLADLYAQENSLDDGNFSTSSTVKPVDL